MANSNGFNNDNSSSVNMENGKVTVYCQIAKCNRRADFTLYNKPVCNQHGYIVQELKRKNPQAFVHWKNPRRLPLRNRPEDVKPRHPYFQ